MNCKKGDLAVAVMAADHYQDFIGAIVTVLRRYRGPYDSQGPGWWIEYRGAEWHCHDDCLRPIRPGGVTDEEVRDLYAPKQTEAA